MNRCNLIQESFVNLQVQPNSSLSPQKIFKEEDEYDREGQSYSLRKSNLLANPNTNFFKNQETDRKNILDNKKNGICSFLC